MKVGRKKEEKKKKKKKKKKMKKKKMCYLDMKSVKGKKQIF